MTPAARATAAALIALVPAWAQAGEVDCVYERGVVVIPASVAGMAGDYILDTGSPNTQLHETKAQMAGFEASALRGRVLIAGLDLRDRPIAVIDLDARTAAFPTPIAGVIGADLLAPYVVDVRFSPCRVAIRRPREARRFAAGVVLPMGPGAVASARAAVADGRHAQAGEMVLSTGSDAALRMHRRLAGSTGDPEALLPFGERRATLRALSFAGVLFENVPAGLLADGEPGALGVIGAPLLAHWRVRFDFPRRRVQLAPP
ncbi:hypothetical protein [Phenylobacterium sp.]|uniref:hypothetical protein n=1 Tax=Phenylobacterium sp. TaxID=1871053 RepID=UPI002733234C|nr:hypothetical protein [Phenylobacterium sp.]MDP3853834.1 hypothetical protein [Phenylobacterium sp.]